MTATAPARPPAAPKNAPCGTAAAFGQLREKVSKLALHVSREAARLADPENGAAGWAAVVDLECALSRLEAARVSVRRAATP